MRTATPSRLCAAALAIGCFGLGGGGLGPSTCAPQMGLDGPSSPPERSLAAGTNNSLAVGQRIHRKNRARGKTRRR